MQCPKCNSHNIQVSTYAEKQRRGCIGTLLLILLCFTIIGIIFVIALVRGKKDVVRTKAVCMDCGNTWFIS